MTVLVLPIIQVCPGQKQRLRKRRKPEATEDGDTVMKEKENIDPNNADLDARNIVDGKRSRKMRVRM